MASIRKMIRVLEQEREDLDREIAKLIDWRARHEILTSVPGVGDATANLLVTDLPELGKGPRTNSTPLRNSLFTLDL